MKKLLPVLVVFGVLIAFIATLAFLYERSQVPDVIFETETAFITDIVEKTVATGSIVPRNEVAIKPRVSGVIESVAVEPGDAVVAGDLIATVAIIPNSLALNNARSALSSAKISLEDARTAMARIQALSGDGAVSSAELQRVEVAFALRQQEHRAASDNLRLIREGAASGGRDVNTEVRATVGGMVLTVPVKLGESVIESNTFNEGTTIAAIADMDDLIFQGAVDESEVGRIQEGMPLNITIGAFKDRTFAGTLEYIAPKGELNEGAVQFEIRAALSAPEGVFVRAGVSANADIVLESRTAVLSVREAVLQFEDEQIYVEVEGAQQVFTRQDITVGLSDGINIEVLGGLSESEQIKKPQ
ncbi:MAG: HlyD family secretion protein [Myxococcota bacterium]|jgi:HlyD family secretion protein